MISEVVISALRTRAKTRYRAAVMNALLAYAGNRPGLHAEMEPVAVKLLNSPQESVVRSAAACLGEINEPAEGTISRLAELLSSESPGIRVSAAGALRKHISTPLVNVALTRAYKKEKVKSVRETLQAALHGSAMGTRGPHKAGGADGVPVDNLVISTADVTVFFNAVDKMASTRVRVTDPEELERLLSFIPEAFSERTSSIAAGWEAETVIEFRLKDGSVRRVVTNYDSYSTGRGDFDVNGDLRGYLAKLVNYREE
jgi:hypothetical protein